MLHHQSTEVSRKDILYDEIYMIMIVIIIMYDNDDKWKIIVYFIMPCYFDQF